MDQIWAVLLLLVVAVPIFLLLRWLATKRAIEQARRRRERERTDDPS